MPEDAREAIRHGVRFRYAPLARGLDIVYTTLVSMIAIAGQFDGRGTTLDDHPCGPRSVCHHADASLSVLTEKCNRN
jgi:hypothetical protein